MLNGKSKPSIKHSLKNYALYRTIKKSYEQNIKTADFDTLIDESDRYIYIVLYIALRQFVENHFATPKSRLTKTIDSIVINVDYTVGRFSNIDKFWQKLLFIELKRLRLISSASS